MASRTASVSTHVSKWFVAIALIAAAAVIGMTAAYVVRAFAGGSAAPAATTVQFVSGAAQGDSLRRHGTQYVGGAAISPAAPRDARDQRGGPRD